MAAAPRAAQVARVRSLYRRSLKAIWDWSVFREELCTEAEKCRAAFEQYRHVQEPDRIDRLIAEGERLLWERRHPDPYINPNAPGGCMYQRNPPVHSALSLVMDYGREPDCVPGSPLVTPAGAGTLAPPAAGAGALPR
uniref:NADH dehydrogenase [ubiquinone] 1 beta subcomplex subunit 9 n=1 Tax=Prasinoderma coloniale TaxID=156133 RepID=A0A6U0MAP0_9VIRI